jgi:hypothetical protein
MIIIDCYLDASAALYLLIKYSSINFEQWNDVQRELSIP